MLSLTSDAKGRRVTVKFRQICFLLNVPFSCVRAEAACQLQPIILLLLLWDGRKIVVLLCKGGSQVVREKLSKSGGLCLLVLGSFGARTHTHTFSAAHHLHWDGGPWCQVGNHQSALCFPLDQLSFPAVTPHYGLVLVNRWLIWTTIPSSKRFPSPHVNICQQIDIGVGREEHSLLA